MTTTSVAAHYEDCRWPDVDLLRHEGRWTVSAAVEVLRSSLRGGSDALSDLERDVIDWTRRDLPELRAASDFVRPEQLYQRIASSGQGEEMFASGRVGALQMGYGGLLDLVDPWSLDRFVGLGCPWTLGLPDYDDRIVDLGCGAGVDLAIADSHVRTTGIAVGVDRLPYLAGGEALATRGLHVMVAGAQCCPLPSSWATLITANGLPPLLGARSAAPVLAEAHRVLRAGGQLRFTTLVIGDDVSLEQLADMTVVDAIRCSKPICSQYRQLLHESGFESIVITEGRSPFIPGYRPGPVRAVCIAATKG